MTNPRRCKIIKCARLAAAMAKMAADLAVASADLLTDAEADVLISALETAAEKIEDATPAPPIV